MYPEEVYTFTPKGSVIVLPRDATPIDFAYAIHSDVGNTCVGAKVNGRIVPLKYNLKNGDVVEILTQSGHLPSKDWLALVKTSRARNKIKHVINTTERVKAIEIGQKYLEREARRLNVSLGRITKAEMERVASEYGYSKIEDLHAALGLRQIFRAAGAAEAGAGSGRGSCRRWKRPKPSCAAADAAPGVRAIRATWLSRSRASTICWCIAPSAAIRFAARAIVGYVTRGKGIAVHSMNCPNVQSLMYEVERKIDVEWARAANEAFPVRMVVYTDDRPGMLNQLTSVLFHEQSNIRSLEATPDDKRGDDGAVMDMTVEIRDKKQLERVAGRDPPHLRRSRRRSERNDRDASRARAHRHFQVERHSGRLERRPSQPVHAGVFARRMSLRQLHRRAWHGAAEERPTRPRPPARSRCTQPTLKMLNVEPVGHYAIRIEWSDGHNTGIYSFDHLRKICPCETCKKPAI